MSEDIDLRVLMPPGKMPSISEVEIRWSIAEKLERQITENLVELKILDKRRAESVIGKELYQEYIKSKVWQVTRQRIFKRDNYTCQICGSTQNLRVHHITYENLGAEKDADLITLCNSCHSSVHANLFADPFFLLKKANEILELWSKNGTKLQREISEEILPKFDDIKDIVGAKKG